MGSAKPRFVILRRRLYRRRRTRASRAMRRALCDAITRAFGSLPYRTLPPPPLPQKHKRRSPWATPSFSNFWLLVLLYHIAIVEPAHYSVQAKIYISFACMHIASMVYFLPIDKVRLRFPI